MTSNIWHSTKDTFNACHCVGKQNGEPFCPCEMRSRGVRKINGRWVEPSREAVDHGAVLSDKGTHDAGHVTICADDIKVSSTWEERD